MTKQEIAKRIFELETERDAASEHGFSFTAWQIEEQIKELERLFIKRNPYDQRN